MRRRDQIKRVRGVKRDCQCARSRHQHGTNIAYLSDKCGCDDCLRAHNQASEYYKLHGTTKPLSPPQSARIPSAKASILVRQILSQTPLTVRQLTLEAGWSGRGAQICRILNGTRPSIEQSTWQRLLTVARNHDVDLTAPPMSKDELAAARSEATRRLQALARRGWGLTAISEKTGVAYSGLALIRSGERDASPPITERIRTAYNQLILTPGPAFNNARWQSHYRRQGWLPAGAWEDIMTGVIDPDWQTSDQYRVPHSHKKTA